MNTNTGNSYQNLLIEDGYSLQPSPERARVIATIGQYHSLPIPSPTKTFQDSPIGFMNPYEEAFHPDQADRLLQYEQSGKNLLSHTLQSCNYFKGSPIRAFRQNCSLKAEWEKSTLGVTDSVVNAHVSSEGLLDEDIHGVNYNMVTDENKAGSLNFKFDFKSPSHNYDEDNMNSKENGKDEMRQKNNFRLTTLKSIDNICSLSSIQGTINKLHLTSPTVSSTSDTSNSISDLSRE